MNFFEQTDKLIIESLSKMGIDDNSMTSEIPPSIELGDICYPLFKYSKALKKAPAQIASDAISHMALPDFIEKAEPKGAYLNIFFKRSTVTESVLETILKEKKDYCRRIKNGIKVLIEFSCPNTNKPLHLGHCRNNFLGDAVANLFLFAGFDVKKVNLINDRGIHICKSMLAYMKYGNGDTPESTGIKSDHFVGKQYVKYNTELKTHPELEKEAQDLLKLWEDGEKNTVELWKQMNKWAIDGIKETYNKMGISFDMIEYESENYLLGKDIVFEGLKNGVFYKADDGSIWIDNEDAGLDKKILLRSDGTSIYITQDLGTAVKRHEKFNFDKMIFVVGQEQEYHFKTLFTILKKLGFDYAENMKHLSYGMVTLPDGKMKSREGTVVDADNLMTELEEMSRSIIKEKGRFENDDELNSVALKVSLGALKYYLLNFTTTKDILFSPEQSISFDGNTGPYIQYTTARINSLIGKAQTKELKELDANKGVDNDKLDIYSDINDDEWSVILHLLRFDNAIKKSIDTVSPLELCGFVYDLCRLYSKFYQDNQIISNSDEKIKELRLQISKSTLITIQIVLDILGITPLEKM